MLNLGIQILILLLVEGRVAVHGTTLNSLYENRSGIRELQKKEPNTYLAYKHFLEALADDPFESRLKINLGLTFELNKEEDKALQEYLGAARMAQTEDMRFFAYFNAARVFAEKGDIPQALAYYQSALDIVPDSKEVKTNIELLWQGGQGKGKGKNKDKSKDGQGDPEQPDPKNGDIQNEPQEPKPFKSEELTQDDVRKILEELKNQEESIRAKEYGKEAKEKSGGKDW